MSKFVVFNTVTEVVYSPRTRPIETEKGAKVLVTKLTKKTGDQYAYLAAAEYANRVIPTKKVKSLMTGEEIEIPVNTPRSCDPSTETYWSM